MKRADMNYLLTAGVASLSFIAGSDILSAQKEDYGSAAANIEGFQDELKLYLPGSALRTPKGRDLMEPSSAATAESNMRVLLDVLGDTELLAAIQGVKQQTCAELQATTCQEHLKEISCDKLDIAELLNKLIDADNQINSATGGSPGCSEALRKGLSLLNLAAITTPLRQFQANQAAGPLPALESVFSILNLAPPDNRGSSSESTDADNPRGSSQDQETQFIELIRLKRKKSSPSSTVTNEKAINASGFLVRAMQTFPGSYLWMAGASGPLAEVNAVEYLNELKYMLSSDQLEFAIPLELHAGGASNHKRLCMSFRKSRDSTWTTNISCRFEDTVLANLEERSTGTPEKPVEVSLIESAWATSGSKAVQQLPAYKNTQLAFKLIALRAGSTEAAASLLVDAEMWWNLMYLVDTRTEKQIADGYLSGSKVCAKALKKASTREINAAYEDSVSCSSKWKDASRVQLKCDSKTLLMQCAAEANLYALFDSGLADTMKTFMSALAKKAVCDDNTKSCSKKKVAKQTPLAYLGAHSDSMSLSSMHGPFAESLLRAFIFLSGNYWKKAKDIVEGVDAVDNMLSGVASLIPSLLSSKLPQNFYIKLQECIDFLVHPLVFLHLNQLSFSRSELSGSRNNSGGLSERLDELIGQAAKGGLPQTLKERLQPSASTTVDITENNPVHITPPNPGTWQEVLKLVVLDRIAEWIEYPESQEQIRRECTGGKKSNIVALMRDSFELLKTSESENLTLTGKVPNPSDTSIGKPNVFKHLLAKVLRLPPYKSQHHLFTAVNVKIPDALKAVRILLDVYLQHKGVFQNEQVFIHAVIDLFAHYEQKCRLPSRGLLGVPGSPFLPHLHPHYAYLPKAARLRELKDSTMSLFFRHIWILIFSVSANNILNAAHLDSVEKLFSQDAWQRSINDPTRANSFAMILRGDDFGIKLFSQLLPKSQKDMLKRAKYGSPTVFTSQMQLTGSLLSASGHAGLGIFLHAQAAYFGEMIRKWIVARQQDRKREIISWLTLGAFFASSFIQVAQEVSVPQGLQNQTGSVNVSHCPPMGVCLDSNGDAFVADSIDSPVVNALHIVLKTGLMASISIFATPVVAVYNIAVSNFQILSRLEMALGQFTKTIVKKISQSKTVKQFMSRFKKEEVVRKAKPIAEAAEGSSLGNNVEQSVTAFFEDACELVLVIRKDRPFA
ncbi:hypothetical protein cyc_02987 [Cyclospora cayetanensis]|uniref:Uncharacterized protein n=1 Tax=Cyclospora cayetanensis TaxID=88456 RepID=A0A1D3CXD8_9EIME|nr:hypothetical protein cyc_02987 [Cyclospora cayetanensis]